MRRLLLYITILIPACLHAHNYVYDMRHADRYLQVKDDYHNLKSTVLNKFETISIYNQIFLPTPELKDTTVLNAFMRRYLVKEFSDATLKRVNMFAHNAFEMDQLFNERENRYRDAPAKEPDALVTSITLKPIALTEHYIILLEAVKWKYSEGIQERDYGTDQLFYYDIQGQHILNATACFGWNETALLSVMNKQWKEEIYKQNSRLLQEKTEELQEEYESTDGEYDIDKEIKEIAANWESTALLRAEELHNLAFFPHPAGLMVYIPAYIKSGAPYYSQSCSFVMGNEELQNIIPSSNWYAAFLKSVRTEKLKVYQLNPSSFTAGSEYKMIDWPLDMGYSRNLMQGKESICFKFYQVGERAKSLMYEMNYDAVKRKATFVYGDNVVTADKDIYLLNTQGQIVRHEQHSGGGLRSFEQYTFNEDGNLAASREYTHDEGADTIYTQWFYCGHTVYKYPSQAFYQNVDDWISSFSVFEVDNQMRLVKELHYNMGYAYQINRDTDGRRNYSTPLFPQTGWAHVCVYNDNKQLISAVSSDDNRFLEYRYDGRGNLVKMLEWEGNSVRRWNTYTYDAQNRLTGFANNQNTFEIVYQKCKP